MTVRSVAKRWVGGVTLVGVLLGCGAKMEADLDGAARRGEAGARGSAGSAQVVAPTGGAVATGPALWAEFSIRIQAETSANPGYVNLLGAAYDAPPLPVEVTVKEIGECKLVASTLNSCAAAPCEFGIETCVSTNRCMALPLAVDAGNAIVVGLANDDGSDVTALSSLNGRYMAMGLAYPACAPGALIRLDGGGNTVSPFTLHANCIEPLELRGPAFWPMEASKPAEFTWVPASTPENSRISVIIDVKHYSAHPVRIRCNTADTGSLRVDAELITALIELGTTHLPRVYLWRVSSRSVPLGSGAVTLKVVSGARKFLDIPGVPFCDNDGMCPTGMLCLLGKCVEGT